MAECRRRVRFAVRDTHLSKMRRWPGVCGVTARQGKPRPPPQAQRSITRPAFPPRPPAAGEPNDSGGTESCVQVAQTVKRMNDLTCTVVTTDTPLGACCQAPAYFVPSPSSTASVSATQTASQTGSVSRTASPSVSSTASLTASSSIVSHLASRRPQAVPLPAMCPTLNTLWRPDVGSLNADGLALTDG